ncbi:MAG: DUF4384 domain-containing protein [Planctomycetes bacterium]|nr:DUF4384 domain-containing protein [Planctomycetota bacterium]
MNNVSWRRLLVLGGLLLAACQTMLPLAGRLLATAVGNYDSRYGKLVDDLSTALKAGPAPGGAATKVGAPISLEVALLRQEEQGGEIVPVAMANGEVLRWRGSLEASDRFKVFFRPSEDCFVYVVLVDGTGFVQVLHPDGALGVPTRGGDGRFLPEGDLDLAYAVDEYVGIETIYFVASRQRRTDLEQALLPFVGRERPPLQRPLSVQQLADDFLELGVAERGTGVAEVRMQNGKGRFDTAAFRTAAGRDLVVTRWFEHR